MGGVRSPQVDVPVRGHRVPNSGAGLCSLAGYNVAASNQLAQGSYATPAAYAFNLLRQTQVLVDQGWFPREYLHEIVEEVSRTPQSPWCTTTVTGVHEQARHQVRRGLPRRGDDRRTGEGVRGGFALRDQFDRRWAAQG